LPVVRGQGEMKEQKSKSKTTEQNAKTGKTGEKALKF
jgi:hypothetical protein